MPEPRLLITSAGRRVQLVKAFQVAVRNVTPAGVVFTCDASESAPASFISDKNFKISRIDSGKYLSDLLRICQENEVNLVVPTIDTELELLAQASKEFAALGISIVVSDPQTIEIASSKRSTHLWLGEQNILTPEQWDFGELVMGAEVAFPMISKPNRGSMSQGVRVIENRQMLERLTEELFDQDYVVESFVTGLEFTVSTYVDRQGKCVAAVPRLRMEVRAGEVSKGKTVQNALLQNTARQVVESLPGARGPVNVQIFLDVDKGECRVIEINARFGGGDPLAWMAGASAPDWIIQEFHNHDLEPLDEWKTGLTMLRFDDAVFIENGDGE